MAEINENNIGSGPPPGTPSKRAEKKQDTRSTPERMKSKEAEMMEIDLDEEQGPKMWTFKYNQFLVVTMGS